jgi:hypothetical protein
MKILPALFLLLISSASAALDTNQVREALPKKTETYLKEGVISGGDRETHFGIVKDVRRALNGGFERIVIDLDADRAPYYQAAIEPNQRRIIVTLFGSPKLALNAKKIVEQFKKSPVVSRIDFFPLVEEDSWTFALYLKAAVPVEIFELTSPTRIIFDLKAGAAMLTETPVKPKTVPGKKTALKKPTPAYPPKFAPPNPIRANPIEEEYEGNGAASQMDDLPE